MILRSSDHVPVLRNEVLEYLNPSERVLVVDATLGLGGHSLSLFRHQSFSGRILGMDQDASHLEQAKANLFEYASRSSFLHMNFSGFPEYCREHNFSFDGILFDLGVASSHLDDAARGFSHRHEGELDMRMDRGSGLKAGDIIRDFTEDRLCDIFRRFGEEALARPIARAICEARRLTPIVSTLQLSTIIEKVYHRKYRKRSFRHPAAKCFQALRIAVNRELEVLEQVLPRLLDFLLPRGRMVVISYHSLEDRIVKRFFKLFSKACRCGDDLQCICGGPKLRVLTRKPVQPQESELAQNPRSRSAKLRAAEKL